MGCVWIKGRKFKSKESLGMRVSLTWNKWKGWFKEMKSTWDWIPKCRTTLYRKELFKCLRAIIGMNEVTKLYTHIMRGKKSITQVSGHWNEHWPSLCLITLSAIHSQQCLSIKWAIILPLSFSHLLHLVLLVYSVFLEMKMQLRKSFVMKWRIELITRRKLKSGEWYL